MALPKEPRQKMINLMYLVLTALLALNVSSEILNAFKVVDASLVTSNTNISSANKTLYTSLLEKVNDEKTREKATPWNEKAVQAKALSDGINTYIDDIKKQLKEAAGLEMVTIDGKLVEKYKEDDLEAATRLFGNGPGGKNLGEDFQKRLNDYRAKMLNLDPGFKSQYEATFPVDAIKPVKGQDGKEKDFTEAYFHMTPTVAGITLLSKFQNNVKNAENQAVTYFHNQIGQVVVHMDQVGVLVGQSSNYVMPGEPISITAGVGAYSSAAKPTIVINGSSVPVTNGQGTYTTTASGAGEHTVSVNVTFIDENGKPQTKPETVKYTVGTPGGAAVMPDKMNVFYIGVDNPVTIGSPTGWDKTKVSISSGSISGSGSKQTVRVSSIGNVTVNVTADGKTTQFPFRVKRIPDPVFKVGSGKARIATVEFKSQQSCRADLENFDFDLRYSVVSATVYFSGANFPTTQVGTINGNSLAPVSALIARCGPGSNVTFVNIKVSGPDGVRNIDERGFSLY
ncbi:MAG: gliding motility protein GldM [Ferruginibacter sp.]|nr:gliding motility protein GldM [Ferruginibacter sp.]